VKQDGRRATSKAADILILRDYNTIRCHRPVFLEKRWIVSLAWTGI